MIRQWSSTIGSSGTSISCPIKVITSSFICVSTDAGTFKVTGQLWEGRWSTTGSRWSQTWSISLCYITMAPLWRKLSQEWNSLKFMSLVVPVPLARFLCHSQNLNQHPCHCWHFFPLNSKFCLSNIVIFRMLKVMVISSWTYSLTE